MTSAVVEPAGIALAVERGRQLALLHPAPPIVEGFVVVPDVETDVGLDDDLVAEARDRYAVDGRVRVTAWCRMEGALPIDDGRVDAVVDSGVWPRDHVEDYVQGHTGVHLSLLVPHVLDDPAVVETPGTEWGQLLDLDLDVDPGRAEPVLARDVAADRHEILKTALGLMV